jgi:PAS domain S-box-containing protein
MDIIRGLECGADNFLTKPYKADQLISRVKTILENRQMRARGRVTLGVDIVFLGKKFTISSEKEQILDLLIATFEDTVRANRELRASQTELAAAKAEIQEHARRLEERVRQRTAELDHANEELRKEVAERTRAEQEVRRTQSFLDLVIENIPAMLFVKDAREHRFVLLNRAGEELLGVDRSEILRKTDHDLFPTEQADRFVAGDREVLETGRLHVASAEPIDTRHRGRRLLQTKKIPVLDERGDRAFVLGFAEDITERRAVEERLQQSQRLEALGQLTGGLSHDSNNLLGIIIGNLDLLKERLGNDAETAEILDEALEAALRGADLNRQLLAFARRQPLQPKRLCVNDLVTETANLLKRTLGEHIEVMLRLADDVSPVEVDRAQLEAALTNLAVNARDAMPRGGRLTVSTRNASLDAEYAAVHNEVNAGEYVVLGVTDTGTGMTPEVLTRAFEPFFTTKEIGKGTGLGLSMVFGFVKQSGGHIQAYSELGHGTTIRVYLPRAAEAHIASAEPAPSDTLPGGSEAVLVVEDNQKLRRLLVKQLGELGYRVVETENAAAALEHLRSGAAVDLLLTDVIMPGGMNGWELAAAAGRLRPGLKTLFTSGFPDVGSGPHGAMPEGALFLGKPYRKQELAQKIRQALVA